MAFVEYLLVLLVRLYITSFLLDYTMLLLQPLIQALSVIVIVNKTGESAVTSISPSSSEKTGCHNYVLCAWKAENSTHLPVVANKVQ